jgi:protein-tyrosine phosphatase
LIEKMAGADVPRAHDPAEILPGLLLGSQLGVSDAEVLRARGVTHVLNATVEIPNFHEVKENTFTYLKLDLNDDVGEDIKSVFSKSIDFVREARSTGGTVVVHCQAGISRSATIVLAFLMTEENMTLREAFLHTKERRPMVGPNAHFFKQLGELEDELRPADQKGQPPSFSVDEYYVQTLVDMGFPRDKAARAIADAEGRFELAVQLCLAP